MPRPAFLTAARELAGGNPALERSIRRSRALLHRRAMVAAAAGVVPVPGLDWAVDAALLSRLLPKISAEFGLLPDQIDRLDPDQKERVKKAIAMVGSLLIGRFITRDLVLRAAGALGLRMSTRQAARFVPLAGQAVSALMGYTTLRYLGEQHIEDCVRVVRKARPRLPAP